MVMELFISSSLPCLLSELLLQQLVKLEEQLGLQFTHISILARAFTCQADDDDALTW